MKVTITINTIISKVNISMTDYQDHCYCYYYYGSLSVSATFLVTLSTWM